MPGDMPGAAPAAEHDDGPKIEEID